MLQDHRTEFDLPKGRRRLVRVGGAGRDTPTGGEDSDTFVFQSASDSGLVSAKANDIITDFTAGQDRIDLSAINANTATAGDDAFTFLGSGPFTHASGQLDFFKAGSKIILQGDVNGDGLADFQIQLNGIASISAGDLVL